MSVRLSPNSEPLPRSCAPRTLVFIGDSITDGDRNKDDNYFWQLNNRNGNGYVYVLASLLGERYPLKGLNIVNQGIAGNRVSDVRARLDSDVIARKPEVVTILVGVNDAPHQYNGMQSTALAEVETDYREIRRKLAATLPTTKRVWIEPFVLRTERNAVEYRQTERYVAALRNLVTVLSCGDHVVKTQDGFSRKGKLTSNDYWVWDGIHPTEAGHGLLAKLWMTVFKRSFLQ